MSRLSEYQRTVSDAVSWHQDQALATRILLLHPTGPAGFVLMDTEDDQKYKVLLGDPHICSCKTFKKEKVPCKHICWILLKKFKVPRTDAISFQLGLVERELQAVLNGFYCKSPQKTTPKKIVANTGEVSEDTGLLRQREITEDDSCPICQEEFLGGGVSAHTSADKGSKISAISGGATHHEPVTYCKYGCGQNVHIRCMKVWASYQKSTVKDTLECPLCRADFGTLRSLMEELHNAQGDIGRNPGGAGQFRNGVRSTVHQFPCYNCSVSPIEGKCYKCRSCISLYLCQQCFANKIHMHHNFDMRQKTKERWIPVDRGFLLVGNHSSGSSSVQQRMLELGLEHRDITENDYDLLMQLDQSETANNSGGIEVGATLSENEVSLLPSMVIRKQHAHLLKPGMQCNLCLQNYRVGQSIRRLTCRHKFHQNCLDGYLLHQSNCCPICHEIVELNVLRPNNLHSETQSEISSSTTSQLSQKPRSKQESKLRELGNKKLTKDRLFSFHGNDSQLEAILTVFGQGDAQTLAAPSDLGLPPSSSSSGKKKSTGNISQHNLDRNRALPNRSRQASLGDTGLGASLKGPIFDQSLTVSSVNSLQPNQNLPPVRKFSYPKNSRSLKTSSCVGSNSELNDSPLIKSFQDKNQSSKEFTDLSVGSRNGKLLAYPRNLYKMEQRHKLKTGGVLQKSAFTDSALLDIVGDPVTQSPNARSRSSLRRETEVSAIRRRSNSLDRFERRLAPQEVFTPFSDLASCDDFCVDDDAIANVSLANQFL